jgi:23S rRNA (guanosine2251-2'-O)-methyltransferase
VAADRHAPAADLVIGRHPIVEALRAGRRRLHTIMVAEGSHGQAPAEIARLASERNVRIERVPRERLDSLADHHQGLIARAAPYPYISLASLLVGPEAALSLSKGLALPVAVGTADPQHGANATDAPSQRPPLLLAVDALQDPQNFGSLLRTALAVGVDGVLLPERRSVTVTPAVGRASAGAIEHLRIARVVNLTRALKELKQAGLWIVGLAADGKQTYDQADLTTPLALVVGSEGSGLSRLVAESCDLTVRLPMLGPLDSLNAAVAGSIVLYEVQRQRAQP